MSKVLYHLSLNTDIIEEFTPRIPESRANWEDEINQRFCMSESIEGCLTAVPWGGSTLDDVFILAINTSKLIRVYEFDVEDIDPEDLIWSDEIYMDGLVHDAEVTKECWFIGKSISPSRSYLIELTDYLDRATDVYYYDDIKHIKYGENEDTIDWDSINLKSLCEIYEAVYNVIPENMKSGIEVREYKLTEDILKRMNERDMTCFDIRHELEDIFGYDIQNYADIDNNILTIKMDTRLNPVNIIWIDEIFEHVAGVY